MALKVELKPHEKIIVGSCVITNTDQRAKFLIEGERLPVLREKDILTPATADTPIAISRHPIAPMRRPPRHPRADRG